MIDKSTLCSGGNEPQKVEVEKTFEEICAEVREDMMIIKALREVEL